MPRELLTFFKTVQPHDLIFLGLVAVIWLLLLFFNLRYYLRLALYKIPARALSNVSVSILMVERNEQDNLEKNLPGWLSMDYPAYEVLVVDDFSEDNSLSVLGTLRLKYPKLKLSRLNQETRYSQKLSRNIALKAASNEVAIFATPSMEMPDPHWLPKIGGAIAEGKKIVVGYSSLVPVQDYYHRLYRIESFYQQTESMAMCLSGLPFIANEENIAFLKKDYFDINGFAGHIREEYLNMELVFNKVVRKKEVAVIPDGTVALHREMSVTRQNFRELLHKSYRLKQNLPTGIRAILGFHNFLRLIWLPLLIVCLLLYPVLWLSLLLLLLILSIVRMFIIKRLLNRMQEPKIFISSLVYGWLIPYYKLVSRWRFNSKRKK